MVNGTLSFTGRFSVYLLSERVAPSPAIRGERGKILAALVLDRVPDLCGDVRPAEACDRADAGPLRPSKPGNHAGIKQRRHTLGYDLRWNQVSDKYLCNRLKLKQQGWLLNELKHNMKIT